MKKLLILIFLIIIVFTSCDKEPLVFTVTFNANGATGTPPLPITVHEREYNWSTGDYWDLIELPGKEDLTYDGKYFYGWNTKGNCKGKRYSSGAVFEITSNVTLYAQWEDYISSAPTLKYSYEDGVVLTWDDIEGHENIENWDNINSFYLYEGKIFTAYVVFRSYDTFSAFWNQDKEFKAHAITSKPYYKDLRYDVYYGGKLEYFVALCVLTTIGYGHDFEIIVGSHSNIISTSEEENMTVIKNFKIETYNTMYNYRLSWDEVPKARGYQLYYNWDGENYIKLFFMIKNTEYLDYLSPGGSRYFRIAAVNRFFEEGPLSEIIYFRNPGPPEKVTNVRAIATSSTSIDISWDEAYGATAYKVLYEIGSSNVKYIADTIIGTNYTHIGLTENTEYRYYIMSIDNYDKNNSYESAHLSDYFTCKTPLESISKEPTTFTLINNTSLLIKIIQINNENNLLLSNLYIDTIFQIQLNSGIYSVSIFDIQDKYMSLNIKIESDSIRYSITDSDWLPGSLTLRNNYSFAVSNAYLRKAYTDNWGGNILNNPILTNSSLSLGIYEQDYYELKAESIGYYRVTSGTHDEITMRINGGVIDNYKTIYYHISPFIFNKDSVLIMPATGWLLY